jgi:hypothetical protein
MTSSPLHKVELVKSAHRVTLDPGESVLIVTLLSLARMCEVSWAGNFAVRFELAVK